MLYVEHILEDSEAIDNKKYGVRDTVDDTLEYIDVKTINMILRTGTIIFGVYKNKVKEMNRKKIVSFIKRHDLMPEGFKNITIRKTDGYIGLVGEIDFDGTDLVIPNCIEIINKDNIGSNRMKLRSVTFGADMKIIDKEAFRRCEALETINFNEGLIEIGLEAFTYNISLKEVKIPKSLKLLSNSAFSHGESLERVIIPEDAGICSCRGIYAPFEYCNNLKDIRVPQSMIDIFNLYQGTGIESISVPSWVKFSVNSRGAGAFSGCKNLKFADISHCQFEDGYIPTHMFSGCSELEEVILPTDVKQLGNQVFEYCTKLTKITNLPNEVKVGSNVFYHAENINLSESFTFIVNAGEHYTTYRRKMMYMPCLISHNEYVKKLNVKLENIPDDCQYIQLNGAEQNLPALTNINFITDKPISLQIDTTFAEKMVTNLKSITGNIEAVDIIQANAFKNCNYFDDAEFVSKVTHFTFGAFDNTALKSVKINKDVSEIPGDTFRRCKDLELVEFEQENPIEDIAIDFTAFLGTKVKFDDEVLQEKFNDIRRASAHLALTGRGFDVEYSTKGVRLTGINLDTESVTLPNQIYSVDIPYGKKEQEFKSLVVSKGTKEVHSLRVMNLEHLYMPDDVEDISRLDVFKGYTRNDTKVVKIFTPITVEMLYCKMNDYNMRVLLMDRCNPFSVYSNKKLSDLFVNPKVSDNIKRTLVDCLDVYHLYDLPTCKYLTGRYDVLDENATIKEILKSNIIDDSIKAHVKNSLGVYTTTSKRIKRSQGVNNIDKFIVPHGVTVIPSDVFDKYPLKEIVLHNNITRIETGAFKGSGIKSLCIPESVQYIGDDAFYGCIDLYFIMFPLGLRTIFSETCKGCSNLDWVIVGEDTYIEDGAFPASTTIIRVNKDNIFKMNEDVFNKPLDVEDLDDNDALNTCTTEDDLRARIKYRMDCYLGTRKDITEEQLPDVDSSIQEYITFVRQFQEAQSYAFWAQFGFDNYEIQKILKGVDPYAGDTE